MGPVLGDVVESAEVAGRAPDPHVTTDRGGHTAYPGAPIHERPCCVTTPTRRYIRNTHKLHVLPRKHQENVLATAKLAERYKTIIPGYQQQGWHIMYLDRSSEKLPEAGWSFFLRRKGTQLTSYQ